ncbi:MAG: exported protein of unknown function [Nitrospira sp.]|nr:exported protein of unknown function [Nitrospira sp.]
MDRHGWMIRQRRKPTVCILGVCASMLILPWVCAAQAPPLPSVQQRPPGQNPQPQGTVPLPNTITQSSSVSSTASGASAPQSVTVPSSLSKSFGTIGRGLPGMTGGPPLTAPMGSQDPSPGFMLPTTIPPLFCDPAVNIPC